MTFNIENKEFQEAVKLLNLGDFLDDNKLGFKINPKTGEVLDSDGKPLTSDKLAIAIIEKAAAKKIDYIFISNSNHTETKKDKLFINYEFLESIKGKYSIAIEAHPSYFSKYHGVDYESAHAADVKDYKNNFLNNAGANLANKQNSKEQLEDLHNIFYRCKLNNIDLIFCESGMEKREKYSSEISRIIDKLKERIKDDVDKKLEKDFTYMDQVNLFKALDLVKVGIMDEQRDLNTSENLASKKATIFRGSKHQHFTNDLDNKLGNSVTILNFENDESVEGFFKNFVKLSAEKSESLQMMEYLKGRYKGETTNIQTLIDQSGITDAKFEMPEYIICNGKLYESEIYLRNHNITLLDKQKSVYDALTQAGVLSTENLPKTSPSKER